MKLRNTLRSPIRLLLILVACVVVAGIVISWGYRQVRGTDSNRTDERNA